MTTQHTPGPWRLSADGQRVIGADGESVVAGVYGAACADQDGAANARLIAAAPAMLEALRLCIGQLEGVNSLSGVHASSLACDLSIARAAIALCSHTKREWALNGWNGTRLSVGMVARNHSPGFGRGCRVRIIDWLDENCARVHLVKVGVTRAGWKVDDQPKIGRMWLEGEPMI